MSNFVNPPAVIVVNADLSSNVLGALQRQLYINETIDGATFDARIVSDAYYVDSVHAASLRVLVIRSFLDTGNRDKADIVLFCKAGLASVEVNKFGEPGKTYPIDRCYLSQFFYT